MNLINLFDHLLSQGQRYIARGQMREARATLERLLAFPDVDVRFRKEAHLLLAEIHLDSQRYRKARRHLGVILAMNPENPEANYHLAQAIDMDPLGNPKLALRWARKAVRLDPTEPIYWCAYAQIAMRLGRDLSAVRAFHKAAKLGKDDLELLQEVVEGLCFLDRGDLAQRHATLARFRLGATPAVQQLWNRLQFLRIHQDQRSSRSRRAIAEGEPVVLKFTPTAASATATGEPGIIRTDRFSRSTLHVPHPTTRGDHRRPS